MEAFRQIYDREPEPERFLDVARLATISQYGLALIDQFAIGEGRDAAGVVDDMAHDFVEGFDAVLWDAVSAGVVVLAGFDTVGHPRIGAADND